MELLLQNRIAGAISLDAKKTAVLGIHWQVDAVKPEGAFGPLFAARVEQTGVLRRTAQLFAAARGVGMTIIYVNVCYWPGHTDLIRNNALFNTAAETNAFLRNTPGVAVVAELAPQAGDFVIEHSRTSAFYGSDLLTILRSRRIETIITTGVATNVAVDHTVRDAAQLGYDTVLLEDCCCTSDPAYHEAGLMSLRVIATWILKAEDVTAAIAARGGLV